jgi:hypothetical protein
LDVKSFIHPFFSIFKIPFFIQVEKNSSIILMKMFVHLQTLDVYVFFIMLYWSDFYILGFVLIKVTCTQVNKMFGDKSWRNQ